MTLTVEAVTLSRIERVVEKDRESTVVVTGVLPPPSAGTLSGSRDVDLTQLTNGAVLVYQESTSRWVATKTLENQVMNGGFF